MPRPKAVTLYQLLVDRRQKLQQSLTRLANAQFTFVKYETSSTEDDLPRILISGSVRVRSTNYRFKIWEDFRESSGTPILYGFTYSLEPQDPGLDPLFRFECHPDVEDAPSDEDSDRELPTNKRNPYSTTPHFHPHKTLTHPISKLHYPFQRSERSAVVFSIIAWIEMDLVKRFYDAGGVPQSGQK